MMKKETSNTPLHPNVFVVDWPCIDCRYIPLELRGRILGLPNENK